MPAPNAPFEFLPKTATVLRNGSGFLLPAFLLLIHSEQLLPYGYLPENK